MADQTKRTVLITGANTGIGFEAVKALAQAQEPYHIFVGSRSVDRGNKAIDAIKEEVSQSPSSIEVVQLDLSSDESIQAAFELVNSKVSALDVLVNNAGIALDVDKSQNLGLRQSWNMTYDVNVSGTHVMTHTFAPLLIKSRDPRLLFLTSGLGNLQRMSQSNYPREEPVPAGWPKPPLYNPVGYRSTKVATNVMMLSWYWTLKEDGVKVWSIAPGFCATNLGDQKEFLQFRGAQHPSAGGHFIRDVIEGKRDDDVGKSINRDGVQTW